MFRFNFILILILYEIYAKDVALVKRQDYENYHICAGNFEIHQDKIIRTEESKRLGAKYLNGKDVSSKDECVKFCCETANCNVFVMEEKVFNQQIGTCYLFECGTPSNFKCKFTRHHNYSSAVLIINRPQMQLEDEIQYTQHERELTNLRSPENINITKNCHHTTKTNIIIDDNHVVETKDPTKPEDVLNMPIKKPSRCSRYQFECRTSGECIAIYNACDGIPQCADHSDEDPELGCPTNAPIISKKPEEVVVEKHIPGENPIAEKARIPVPNKMQQEMNIPDEMKNQIDDQMIINRQSFSRQYKLNQWNKMNQPNYNMNQNDVQNYPTNMNADPRLVMNQHQPVSNYGREGELAEPNPWTNKNGEVGVFKQSYGPLRNFNHKQNDINIPYNYGEYGNMGMNQQYDKYNNAYPGNYYQSNANSWHPNAPLTNYVERQFPELKNVETPRGRIVPEYFYEEVNAPVTKTIEPAIVGNISPKTIYNSTIKAINEKKQETTLESSTNNTKSTTQIVKSTSSDITTTAKTNKDHETASAKQLQDKNTEQNAHRKLEKQFSAEVADAREQLLEANIVDGYTEQPSGAFISLTLGLCVTAIMIFVVGCRLKVVRKRIRRGGKAPYAHDADFLVNGMYL